MATITLTTTANQDTILARLLVAQNASRVEQQLAPYADVQAMVRGILVGAVQSWRAQQEQEDTAQVGKAYVEATPAKQASVRSTLGL